MNQKKFNISFAAINQYEQTNEILPIEKEIRGQNFISWGEDNSYPFYLLDLYQNVSTLHSIIDGLVDYVCGNEIKSHVLTLDDEQMADLINDIALSYAIYGGFALNIVRNRMGGIAQVICMDFRYVRSNKKGDILYYSEDFGSKSYGRGKYIAYPKYDKDDVNNLNSILYVKNNKFSVYPMPMYQAAIKSCELEKSIDTYHINAINNGFMGSVLVSLNNGVPEDEVKEQFEEDFNEKFSGKDNAGRIIIAYNDDKEHAAEIAKIDTEDFSARYQELAKRSREQIYTAFRVTPNIMGLPTETTGFNSEEYKQAYALFYGTVVRPIQNFIVKTLNKLFDCEAVSIEPFRIDFEETEKINNVN